MDGHAPNVILIHCHDLGRHVGCYGADVDTPNVDRLSDEGVRFANHFVSAPQCSPSRGSLFTGLYPHNHGLLGLAHTEWELDVDRVLPRLLSRRGYETHLFGLQHVSEDPADLGYDRIHSRGQLSPDVSPELHTLDRARDVAAAVADHLENGVTSPFFASVGFFEAHRIENEDAEEDGETLYGFGTDYDTDDPSSIDVPDYLPDEPGVRADLADMHGMVYAIDEALGEILDALDETGLSAETLVAFTTEHGIAFPRAKGTPYDPGIEGLLLMRYPPLLDDGTVVDDLVSNVDVLPTILDVVGEDVPADLDGRSLLGSFVDDEPYRPRDHLFAEITWHDAYVPMRAVRTDRFKYARSFWRLPEVYLPNDVFASRAGRTVRGRYARPDREYEELYDLRIDPGERENVADDEEYEGVRRELESTLRTWMHETDDRLLDGPVPPSDYERTFDGLR